MEPHKTLSGIEEFKPDLADGPDKYFAKAHAFAKKFYSEQMDEIASVKPENVMPDHFFHEYVWVVHATGFSAKAVGNFMPRLSRAYGPWNNLGKEDFATAFERVKKVCNNPQKAKAIHSMASTMVKELDEPFTDRMALWDTFKQERLSTPALLTKLPYIGKITCFHLGRNIGLLECVKPDLHLIRMAEYWGFKDCEEMCRKLRPEGMPLGIVDLILWYAASTFGTIDIRKEGAR